MNLQDEISAWVASGRLRPQDAVTARQLACITPGPVAWRRFAERLLLWAGILLVASGVIYFFAYNWNALSRMTRFAIAQTVFAAAFVTAASLGPSRSGGRAALLLASLLAGALLALFGQTYQTGADSYVLFVTWCAALLPWAVVARFAPLWLLCLALANTAVGTYFQATRWEVLGFDAGESVLIYLLLALNVGALVVWESGLAAGASWLGRWGARLIAITAGGIATVLGVWSIIETRDVGPLAFPIYVALLSGLFVYYRYKQLDVLMLSGGLLSVIVAVATLLLRAMESSGEAAKLLFIGFAILGMSAAGGAWIRNVARRAQS